MRNPVYVLLAVCAFADACSSGGSNPNSCTNCSGCCQAGVCQAGTADSACGSAGGACAVCSGAQTCQSGTCRAPALLIGGKCTTNGDCGTGICAPDVPGGGYCTQDCSSSSCPTGSRCINAGSFKLCLESCSVSSDCRSEHLCFSYPGGNLCLPKCTQDSDCDSYNCDAAIGTCGPSRVGNSCGTSAGCGQAPAFCDTSATGGYCSLPCGGEKSAPCPSGSNCVALAGGTSVCLKACAVAGDCRTGYLCGDDGSGVLSCLPKCTSDVQCGPGRRCDTPSGGCVAGGPPAGQIGSACTAAADCSSAKPGANPAPFCGNYPGGYCSLDCSAQSCPSGSTCIVFSSGSNDCLNDCATASDCRPGYLCAPLVGGGAVCVPGCQADTDCSTGEVCDKSSGKCVAASSGSGTTVDVVDLTAAGAVTVYTNQLSAPLSTTLPTDAVSVTFVGQAADPTALVVVYLLISPDGTLFDFGSTSTPMKVLPPVGPGAFAVLAPNTPILPFTPGIWTVRLLGSKQTTATVKALIKRSPTQLLTAGNIDLNLFFVGLSNLSAATAPTDPNFQTIVNRVKTVWSQVGIGIGNVTYQDITGADATRFRDLNADTDLGALMQKSLVSTATDNALNVFFVRTITGGGIATGYIILGESAGIPGVPIRGTSGSGLAVTTADFPNGLNQIADTWVHEGSHWLGLFHPTESAGTAFDPLPDTPECHASTRDTDHDGLVQPEECVGFGADNVMFWTSVPAIPNSNLTPNQQFVLLRNPAVH